MDIEKWLRDLELQFLRQRVKMRRTQREQIWSALPTKRTGSGTQLNVTDFRRPGSRFSSISPH